MKYKNGNAEVELFEDGTRTIEFNGELNLDFPLNIDIRVSTSCSFADNICKDFCHESAVRKGKDADYIELKSRLQYLPKGIEFAIGCNAFTPDLVWFLKWCDYSEYICNLTINQGHIKRDLTSLKWGINFGFIKGLGISYRSSLKWDIPNEILNYKNTVFHVIMGIDSIEEVKELAKKGVKKILVLGEKDFGYNSSKVNLDSRKHKEWRWWIKDLQSLFDVVSFDNLALQQLEMKRFFSQEQWNRFYQGEHSFYIDAVNQTFSPSSRSSNKTDWNTISIQQYFKQLEK